MAIGNEKLDKILSMERVDDCGVKSDCMHVRMYYYGNKINKCKGGVCMKI